MDFFIIKFSRNIGDFYRLRGFYFYVPTVIFFFITREKGKKRAVSKINKYIFSLS
jgi:hypothetical protein